MVFICLLSEFDPEASLVTESKDTRINHKAKYHEKY